ncbi:MAG: LysR family transcriptional regulator [Myxococcota bacterium]
MSQMVQYHVTMKDVHELGDIDLNLLTALDALIDEVSVTRAAKRVGVSQSAMSHTLRRLRQVFDDPLLVRAGGAMVLTPRAEALAPTLQSGLRTLAQVLAPVHFDPSTAERTFRIAAPDLFLVAALPKLAARLRRDAPGIGLSIRPFAGPGIVEGLTTGELDLAILAREQVEAPPGIVARTLLRDTFSCFVGRDGPAAEDWTLEAYVAATHAMVSPQGDGRSIVDVRLAERGLKRRIGLRLPDFVNAPKLIEDTDLVLTAPTTLVRTLPVDGAIEVRELPLPVPAHSVASFWHERFNADPGHRWFRERLATQVSLTSVRA